MKYYTINPKKLFSLIYFIPPLILITLPIFFISFQNLNFISIISSLVALTLISYFINTNINRILINESSILLLPFLGKYPIKTINFKEISQINIFKIKEKIHKIGISTVSGIYYEINTNHYKIEDKNYLIEELKKNTSCTAKEISTYSFSVFIISSILTYSIARFIESDILKTDHQSPLGFIFIIFILLITPIFYISYIVIKMDNASKKLLILSPILTLAVSFLFLNLIYFYNESYPVSIHQTTIKLESKDGNYQYWKLSDDIKATLMIKENTFNTHIKQKKLPDGLTLIQGSEYQVTLQTGLLNDVFIIANTIKPVN